MAGAELAQEGQHRKTKWLGDLADILKLCTERKIEIKAEFVQLDPEYEALKAMCSSVIKD